MNQENSEMVKKKFPFSGKAVRWVILILIVLVVLFNTFYNVNEQEQAVVTMFGQVQQVNGAGLYVKIPFLQQVKKVDTTTKGVPIGYRAENGEGRTAEVVDAESMMITSDFNFVDVDFYLEYRVSDPVKYLYASSEPETILANIAQASIRSTIVDYSVDDVITTGKSQIQADVRDLLIKKLEESDIGLTLVNISLQDAEPPTSEVMEAFKAVETAKQGADTAVNNAKKYQNEQIPAAEAEADKIIQSATAEKEARIAEAAGQVERFNQMFAEYSKYPLITKQRMFYEMMEELLPGLKVIITDGGTETMLPLDNFASLSAASSTSGSAAAERSTAGTEAADEGSGSAEKSSTDTNDNE